MGDSQVCRSELCRKRIRFKKEGLSGTSDMPFQVTDVGKPLASATRILNKGILLSSRALSNMSGVLSPLYKFMSLHFRGPVPPDVYLSRQLQLCRHPESSHMPQTNVQGSGGEFSMFTSMAARYLSITLVPPRNHVAGLALDIWKRHRPSLII